MEIITRQPAFQNLTKHKHMVIIIKQQNNFGSALKKINCISMAIIKTKQNKKLNQSSVIY